MRKERWPLIFFGIAVGFLFTLFYYSAPEFFIRGLNRLDNFSYDYFVKNHHPPLDAKNPVIIVDIDDRSLQKGGRWPWSRDKIAELTAELYRLKAKVIAYDIVFSDVENQTADAHFSEILAQGQSVLSFAFTNQQVSSGVLPSPFLELSRSEKENLFIPEKTHYISNLSIFEKSAPNGGFIDAEPDLDGVMRYAPVLLRNQDHVFSSLALAAVSLYLNNPNRGLITSEYEGEEVLEGIQLGEIAIPTDPWGKLLIPFRGPPYTVPYISAIDILEKKVPIESIQDKLILIGSSATAAGDLSATAIAPVFANIEIHAQICASIYDQYLPFKPTWTRGAILLLLLILSFVASFILPFLGPLISFLFTILVSIALFVFSYQLWVTQGIFFPVLFPIFTLLFILTIDEIAGFGFEKKKRRKIRQMFDQYLPKERVEEILEKGEKYVLEGQNLEMTVLFADIRGFTHHSEKMSAPEVKDFLNHFFTDMTEAIFQERGTIDKYIGDAVMAFWGAPIQDPNHAADAIKAGFKMLEKMKEFSPPIKIGIGINTGMMCVGDMGSDYRRSYTVLGDPVNVASRLEEMTKTYPVGILVGSKTAQMAQETIVFRCIDEIKVRGREQKEKIYQPLGFKDQMDPKKLALVDEHEKAMQALFSGNLDEAKKGFLALKEKGEPELYNIYLNNLPG